MRLSAVQKEVLVWMLYNNASVWSGNVKFGAGNHLRKYKHATLLALEKRGLVEEFPVRENEWQDLVFYRITPEGRKTAEELGL